jgi:hypothetical protein
LLHGQTLPRGERIADDPDHGIVETGDDPLHRRSDRLQIAEGALTADPHEPDLAIRRRERVEPILADVEAERQDSNVRIERPREACEIAAAHDHQIRLADGPAEARGMGRTVHPRMLVTVHHGIVEIVDEPPAVASQRPDVERGQSLLVEENAIEVAGPLEQPAPGKKSLGQRGHLMLDAVLGKHGEVRAHALAKTRSPRIVRENQDSHVAGSLIASRPLDLPARIGRTRHRTEAPGLSTEYPSYDRPAPIASWPTSVIRLQSS